MSENLIYGSMHSIIQSDAHINPDRVNLKAYSLDVEIRRNPRGGK
jgi:hypothetical protein